jgi:hypothetical protein
MKMYLLFYFIDFTSPRTKRNPKVKNSKKPTGENREESFLGGDNRPISERLLVVPEEAGIISIDYQLYFDDPVVHTPVKEVEISPLLGKIVFL